MGIISGLATLMLPFISATIAFCSAFIITIWFSLTIIYGIIEIINLLLGQPLVGWLMTGNINATNDIRDLFNDNMFSFTSPMMLFLYVGLAISAFMFLIYFIYNAIPFGSARETMSFSSGFLGFALIVLAICWMPFLYSLLVLVSCALMTGLNSLLSLAKINNSETSNFNVVAARDNVVSNLIKLKNLKEQGEFLYVDINKQEIQDWMKTHLQSNEIVSFNNLIESWNNFLSDQNLSIDKIDKWIILLNDLDVNDFSNLTSEQKEILTELGSFSQSLDLMNIYYNNILVKILDFDELEMFNKWFISSTSIDFKNFRLNQQIFNLNNLENNVTIERFAFYIVNNGIIYSNKFSQNIVNILYSLALGKDMVFVPGWSDNVIGQSWDLFWMIPKEMKMVGMNITVYLFYNIKVIAIGTIINSVLITSMITFSLVLLRRFVYIAFWPIYMLFCLSRAGQGDLSFARDGISELFHKFISILIFGLLWNFICLLTTSIFAAIDQIKPSDLFGSETWIMDLFKLFVVIGIIICGFSLINDFLQKLAEEKSPANAGAAEASKAASSAGSQTSKIKNKATNSASKAAKSVGKKTSQAWNGAGKNAWNSSKGTGFKNRASSTAKAMAGFKKGGK